MRTRLSVMSSDKSEPVNLYDVFEGIVSVRSVFSGIDKGVCDRKILEILFCEENIKGNGRLLGFLKARSFVYGYQLRTVPKAVIESYADGSSHGGLIMLCGKRIFKNRLANPKDNGFYIYLEGIEDPFNLGFAIRSAYAAVADAVLLSPHNPLSSAGIVCRSSAGASELSEIVICSDSEALKELKRLSYKFVCSDKDAPVSAFDADLSKPICLAIGGEKRGLSSLCTVLADFSVSLPYGSDFPMALSAASSAAVLSFEVLRQNRGN